MGMTVTAISMITVPATVGVITRRRSDRRDEIRNWNREEATISVASSAGPPRSSAATDTAMKTPDVPMSRTYPAPILPIGLACTSVVMPQINSAAKAAQVRYASLPPPARTTIATVMTMPAMLSRMYWNASPNETG